MFSPKTWINSSKEFRKIKRYRLLNAGVAFLATAVLECREDRVLKAIVVIAFVFDFVVGAGIPRLSSSCHNWSVATFLVSCAVRKVAIGHRLRREQYRR